MPKLVLPPGQIVRGISGRPMQKERTVIKGGKHGLHVCKVCASGWDDQSCVKKLAVELCFKEVVCAFGFPFHNGHLILCFLSVW